MPFKPGQSGNPAGRAKDPEWLKDAKTLPRQIAAKLWSKWLSLEAEQIFKISEDYKESKLSSLEMGIARAIARDIELGDLRNIEIGLSRIIGRIQDAPPVDTDEDLDALPPHELLERVRKAVTVLDLAKATDGTFRAREKDETE